MPTVVGTVFYCHSRNVLLKKSSSADYYIFTKEGCICKFNAQTHWDVGTYGLATQVIDMHWATTAKARCFKCKSKNSVYYMDRSCTNYNFQHLTVEVGEGLLNNVKSECD